MKSLKLFTFIASISVIGIFGCQKGATGPAGPKGPAGPDSVFHSAWITLNTPFNATDSLYEEVITASGLTSSILDNGVVLSYIGNPNGSDTAVLTIAEASILYGPISQELHVGKINLYATSDYTGALYRYVFLPGTILTGRMNGSVYTKQQLQSMSYSEVQNLLKGMIN